MPGKSCCGESVATTMQSISSGSIPAFASACRAAWCASSAGPLPASTWCRSRDARALLDPLVARVHELREIRVGHHARRARTCRCPRSWTLRIVHPPSRQRSLEARSLHRLDSISSMRSTLVQARCRERRDRDAAVARGDRARRAASGRLVEDQELRLVVEPELGEHSRTASMRRSSSRRRGVDHVQEQRRVADLLERGAGSAATRSGGRSRMKPTVSVMITSRSRGKRSRREVGSSVANMRVRDVAPRSS